MARRMQRAQEDGPGRARVVSYVLLVDDDADARAVLADVLDGERFSVATATNGAEGAAIVRARGAPAAVVTDLHMPIVDGLGLIDSLRAGDETRTTPILLVTADGSAALPPAGVELLRKPVNLDAVVRFVRRHARSARISDPDEWLRWRITERAMKSRQF